LNPSDPDDADMIELPSLSVKTTFVLL
jgi:hypothetical protein